MRPLKLYIATSLDGYIATADGSVEWLDAYQSDEEDYGYHRQLKSLETGKDIWLVGGGEIISLLLAENLIDEMLLCIFPVMLGNGIPLFPPSPALSKWQLEEQRSFPSGVTMLTYKLS